MASFDGLYYIVVSIVNSGNFSIREVAGDEKRKATEDSIGISMLFYLMHIVLYKIVKKSSRYLHFTPNICDI